MSYIIAEEGYHFIQGERAEKIINDDIRNWSMATDLDTLILEEEARKKDNIHKEIQNGRV